MFFCSLFLVSTLFPLNDIINYSFPDQFWILDDCKLRNKADVWNSDSFFLTTNGELVRKTLEKQGYIFTFLLLDLDPSHLWNANATGNLASKKTLELLTDSDGKRIDISNFKFNEDGFIENPQTNDVLEATVDNKVIVNPKDTDKETNKRQLWKKGCDNFEGYFLIEHSESQMLLTVTNDDAINAGYSIVLIGEFKTLVYIYSIYIHYNHIGRYVVVA